MRSARSVALIWLAVYLAGSGVVLLVGRHWKLAVLHLVLIVIAQISLRSRTTMWRLVGDLLPLVVSPLLYGEIPALIATVGAQYHDAAIQALELRLFGTQPSRVFASAMPITLVSEVMHAGYLAYYPAIFVPPLLLLARDERRGFALTVLTLTATYTICWILFVVMPVEGPRYLWTLENAPDGPFRRLAVGILAAGSSRGAAFPSSHMAIAVAQTIAAWKWQPRLAPLLGVVATLVGLGAVYGGFHYASDMIAGAFVGAAVALTVMAMFANARE